MTALTLTRWGPMMPDVTARRNPAWTGTTLGPVVVDYLTYLRDRRRSEHTIHNREDVLSRMCELLDGYHLPDLEGKQGRQVLEEVLVRRAWAGLHDNSLGTYIGTLKSFFSWAYDEELILRDPTRRIEPPKVRRREYVLFTPEETVALVKAQPFKRDRVALMLHFEFAMRASDLRLLRLGDIDPGRKAVRLRNGKGGTDYTLSFRTPGVLEAVNAYLTLDRRGHPEEFLLYPMRAFTRGDYKSGLELLSEPRSGEPYREPKYEKDSKGRRYGTGQWTEYAPIGDKRTEFSPSGLRCWWDRCLTRAELPHRRMHDARHTTATELVGLGKNPRTVSKFLRHAGLNTLDIYIHLNELEMMRDELWGGE